MISQEDLALEGYVGATIAYGSFDPSLGHTDDVVQSFRTHAFPYIKSAMLTYCRKFGHALSISEKAARDDLGSIIGIGVVHIDQFDDDEEFDIPVGSGVEISQDVDEYFLAGFTELERNLVKDHMIDGYSLQELSNRHSVSKSRAGEIIRKLTERMKTRAENYVKDD
jgi:DNA-directed RNA polymerase specialized sigma subunit